MSAVVESSRRSARMTIKAGLIHEEAAELAALVSSLADNFELAFGKCQSLWHLWRSLIEDFDPKTPADQMRDLAAVLRADARQTLEACTLLGAIQGHPECEDDLKLMDRELVNVNAWLREWPDDDPSRRDAARQSIEAGEFVSDDEFLVMTK